MEILRMGLPVLALVGLCLAGGRLCRLERLVRRLRRDLRQAELDAERRTRQVLERLNALAGPAEPGGGRSREEPSTDASNLQALAAEELEAQMSRAMQEGMENLLQYSAGKAPGVEAGL